MLEILQYCTSGLCHFIGCSIIIYLFLDYLFRAINRFFRHLNIRSKGWPPEYLDADGDFKQQVTEDEEES